MNESGYQDPRRHKRVSFIQEIEIIGVGMFQSVELGIGGMYLKTIHPYSAGTVIELQFKLRDTDEHPIIVQSCVLYSHKKVGVGLGFLGLKLEDRQKIEKFIESAKL